MGPHRCSWTFWCIHCRRAFYYRCSQCNSAPWSGGCMDIFPISSTFWWNPIAIRVVQHWNPFVPQNAARCVLSSFLNTLIPWSCLLLEISVAQQKFFAIENPCLLSICLSLEKSLYKRNTYTFLRFVLKLKCQFLNVAVVLNSYGAHTLCQHTEICVKPANAAVEYKYVLTLFT